MERIGSSSLGTELHLAGIAHDHVSIVRGESCYGALRVSINTDVTRSIGYRDGPCRHARVVRDRD